MGRLLAQGRAPSEIVQLYAAEDARRGRNEPCTCGSGCKWKNFHQDSAASDSARDLSCPNSGHPNGMMLGWFRAAILIDSAASGRCPKPQVSR